MDGVHGPGMGVPRAPQNIRPQNLLEKGLPKYAGPAWEARGDRTPWPSPKNFKKQEGS